MQADKQDIQPETTAAQRKAVLELVFISLLGLVVIGGFIAALTYDFVSARAPLFIMVPLLFLIGLQINRARQQTGARQLLKSFSIVFKGQDKNFNSVLGFTLAMASLLLLIYVAGHYVGVSVFMLVLLRKISNESWKLSLLITTGVTLFIYVLFEHGFSIELYRGLVARFL